MIIQLYATLKLWLKWVLATALGAGLGWLAVIIMLPVVGLLLIGTIISGVQWLLLRRLDPKGWWIVTGSIGWIGGGIVVSNWPIGPIGIQAIIAIAMSVMQGFVLRCHPSKALLWMLVASLSWFIALQITLDYMSYLFEGPFDRTLLIFMPFFGMLGGLVAGGLSGIVMVWIMRDKQPAINATAV